MSRYSVSILFCLFICSGLWAAVKADDDALLLKLDKMIEHREVYQQKVEKEILIWQAYTMANSILQIHITRII